MVKNAYIHIPFCKSKCNYCSFISYDRLDLKELYINALISQINAEYNGENLNTLYFGGGTPSLLTIDEIQSIFDLFNFEDDAEITCEVNPDSVDLDYLSALRKLGINRLSIGSQTFNDEILKNIGRLHTAEQIKEAVEAAKGAGFNNVSLDFIYGLPNQGLNDFVTDLKIAIGLDVQHISLYGLKIEKGCYFYDKKLKKLPDADLQADMYLKAVEILKNAGFEHYEISNFSKIGFNSSHNLNYWNNNTYYGFGCSASGYTGGIRYTDETDLEKYIRNPLNRISEHQVDEIEMLEESIFLGFRKLSGINIEEINQKYKIDFDKKYAKILDKYLKSGHMNKTKNGYALSLDGLLVSNEILAEFLE